MVKTGSVFVVLAFNAKEVSSVSSIPFGKKKKDLVSCAGISEIRPWFFQPPEVLKWRKATKSPYIPECQPNRVYGQKNSLEKNFLLFFFLHSSPVISPKKLRSSHFWVWALYFFAGQVLNLICPRLIDGYYPILTWHLIADSLLRAKGGGKKLSFRSHFVRIVTYKDFYDEPSSGRQRETNLDCIC